MTPTDLITEAMAAIGEISPRQTPSRSELRHGLSLLNDILSGWSAQHRKVYSIDNLRFPLTDGKGKYTLGPGGDFESFRPVKIESANVLRYDSDTVGLAHPLELVSSSDWAAIPEKQMGALEPLKLYNDNQYPKINLHLWPIPVCSMGGFVEGASATVMVPGGGGTGGGTGLPIGESDVTSLITDLGAKAPLSSPAFTGNPTAPTPSPGDSDTSIATTGFVQAAIAGLTGGGGGGELSLPIGESDVTSLITDLGAKAPLSSPAFTGNPTAPTPSPGDNDTSIATTAFVHAAVAGLTGGGGGGSSSSRVYEVAVTYDSGSGSWSVPAGASNLVLYVNGLRYRQTYDYTYNSTSGVITPTSDSMHEDDIVTADYDPA